MRVIYILSVILLLFSCSSNEEEIVGVTSTISIEKNNIEVDNRNNNFNLSTKTGGWWIQSIIIDDEVTIENELIIGDDGIKRFNDSIIGDWFMIKKEGDKSLSVTIKENLSQKNRKITVTLSKGNTGESFEVTQSK